jgi:hypothetical protein
MIKKEVKNMIDLLNAFFDKKNIPFIFSILPLFILFYNNFNYYILIIFVLFNSYYSYYSDFINMHRNEFLKDLPLLLNNIFNGNKILKYLSKYFTLFHIIILHSQSYLYLVHIL